MKQLLLGLLLLAGSPVTVCAAEKVFNLAGAGAVVATSPYEGVKTKARAIPFLVGEYKDLYIKGVEAGYHFYRQMPWTLSVVVVPRFMGYSSEDSDALLGMEDRRMSLDAGIRMAYALPWHELTVSVKAVTDTLSRHDGSEVSLAVGRDIKGKICRFSPSIGLRYQDEALTRYYYGVEDNEVRAGRQGYAPRGALDPFADLVFSCGIAKRLIVVTRFGVEVLDKTLRKSPLVDENHVLSAAAGLTYRF